MPRFYDEAPFVRVLSVPFDYTLWDAVNQSKQLYSINPETELGGNLRILSVCLEKTVPFDRGSLQFGSGAVASQRATFGTAAEVDCQNAGTVELNAWRDSSYGSLEGGWNNFIQSGPHRITARLEGALPTQGQMTLYIQVLDLSPRDAL